MKNLQTGIVGKMGTAAAGIGVCSELGALIGTGIGGIFDDPKDRERAEGICQAIGTAVGIGLAVCGVR